jgi:glucose/arabinose dehydrogenase
MSYTGNMRALRATTICIFIFSCFILGAQDVNLSKIMLPKGYKIEIYAAHLPGVREMDFTENGTLFAGSTSGKVYAIRPDRSVIIVDDNLEMPAGLDYYQGNLYVAEISRILKYENILQNLDKSPKPVIVNDNFPKDKYNGLKFIRVGPDGKIYIPVGAPCNACVPDKVWYARILRMSLDGKVLEYFAEGVRNAGGFDWNPASGIFWFDDNGRDDMGDDKPPDELNIAPVVGQHYGFPYVNGNAIDPKFWPQRPKSSNFTAPAFELPAHAGASGMCFYAGKMFDKKYEGGIFIAEHGSSASSKMTCCRISFVSVNEDRAIGYEVFAGGWLLDGKAWGRPADVQVGPDGSLFVSDDLAGCIYRIFR